MSFLHTILGLTQPISDSEEPESKVYYTLSKARLPTSLANSLTRRYNRSLNDASIALAAATRASILVDLTTHRLDRPRKYIRGNGGGFEATRWGGNR